METVFDFQDYKKFISHSISIMPNKGRGQINKIAIFLDVHPTLVSQVITSNRDFSIEQIHKLSSYLNLSPKETDYFILLLQKCRAGTHELKAYYQKKLEELQKNQLNLSQRLNKKNELGENERTKLYSTWIYSAIWLQTSIEKNGQTAEKIASELKLNIRKVTEVLLFLKEVGLCEEKNGRFSMNSQHIHLEFGSAQLSKHHSNWRIKGLQRIDDIREDELMFTSPISISKSDFLLLREEIVKFLKKATKIVSDSPPEELACLNIDLFRIKED